MTPAMWRRWNPAGAAPPGAVHSSAAESDAAARWHSSAAWRRAWAAGWRSGCTPATGPRSHTSGRFAPLIVRPRSGEGDAEDALADRRLDRALDARQPWNDPPVVEADARGVDRAPLEHASGHEPRGESERVHVAEAHVVEAGLGERPPEHRLAVAAIVLEL